MLRNRTASRFLNIFVKEGQQNERISDPAMLLAPRKALVDFQKFVNSGSIEHSLMELVKIRASQINGCAYCLAMHWRDALQAGERIDRLSTLAAWREANWFTPRERAGLAWTEALTHVSTHEVSDDLYEQCLEVFTEQEMVDLTSAIIAINSWNRLSIAFGTQPAAFSLTGER